MFSEEKKQQAKKNNPEEIFAALSGSQIGLASNWDSHPLPHQLRVPSRKARVAGHVSASFREAFGPLL